MDLGAGPWRTFFTVTLPAIAPGVLAAALLVFALSIDDYVVTSFVAGRGRHDPARPDLLDGAQRHLARRSTRSPRCCWSPPACCSSRPAGSSRGAPRWQRGAARARPGPRAPGRALRLGRGATRRRARAEPLHLVQLHRAGDGAAVRGAPRRARQPRPLRHATRRCWPRSQAGNVGLRRALPLELHRRDPARSRACCARSTTRALPHLANVDPRFLDRAYDPGNRYSVPYFWGTGRHRLPPQPGGRGGLVGARCGTRASSGRILMLDDARETLGAALKLEGPAASTPPTPATLRGGPAAAPRAEAAGARLQLVELRGRAALRRRVAGPGLERPVRARSWSRTPTSTT